MSLKSKIWISAQVRQCDMHARPAVISRRGDADAGSILLRLDLLDGRSVVLSQIRDANGQRCWLKATGEQPVADPEAEAYLSRRIDQDPDIWILEIEDPKQDYEPDAPVVL